MKLKYQYCYLDRCHSGYFQGFGVSFTDYDHAVVGVGDTEQEAFKDALDMMYQMGGSGHWRVAAKIEKAFERNGHEFDPASCYQEAVDEWIASHDCPAREQIEDGVEDAECECNSDDIDNECYVYVGIRWCNPYTTKYAERVSRG